MKIIFFICAFIFNMSLLAQVGVGTTSPQAGTALHVVGDVLFEGDLLNQEVVGSHSSTTQNIPFTNGVFNPLTGTVTSITIGDGSGVDNSAVFISGFARVFGGNLNGANSSLGGYFLILQRDECNFCYCN